MLEDNSIERVAYHLAKTVDGMGAFLNPALHSDIIELTQGFTHIARDNENVQMLAIYFEVLVPADSPDRIKRIMDAIALSDPMLLETDNDQTVQIGYFLVNPAIYATTDNEVYVIEPDPDVPTVLADSSQAQVFPHPAPEREALSESKADGVLTPDTFALDWSDTLSFPIVAILGGFVLQDEYRNEEIHQ